MSGPQNAIVGDLDEPTQIPETEVDLETLGEVKKMAKYSKTAEFKRLEQYIQDRISFFSRHFPNGTPIDQIPKEERDGYWVAACIITREFQSIIDEYSRAREDAAQTK